MSCFEHDQSRRAFLKRGGALGLAGVATPFVTSLAAIGEAAAATATDYKALVCVFLYGGNDYANTLPPYDQASYNLYQAARPNIAHRPRRARRDRAQLRSTRWAGGNMRWRRRSRRCCRCSTRASSRRCSTSARSSSRRPRRNTPPIRCELPPKLFSHNDQQSYFQASNPEGATSGWGGRIGDLFQSGNGSSTLTCINASGNAVYLTGRSAVQYSVGTGGPIALLNNATTLYGSATAASTLRSADDRRRTANLFANEHAVVSKRALDTYTQVTGALAGAPAANFPLFPDRQQPGRPAQDRRADDLGLPGARRQAAGVLRLARRVRHPRRLVTDHPTPARLRRRGDEGVLRHHRRAGRRRQGDDLHRLRFRPHAASRTTTAPTTAGAACTS